MVRKELPTEHQENTEFRGAHETRESHESWSSAGRVRSHSVRCPFDVRSVSPRSRRREPGRRGGSSVFSPISPEFRGAKARQTMGWRPGNVELITTCLRNTLRASKRTKKLVLGPESAAWHFRNSGVAKMLSSGCGFPTYGAASSRRSCPASRNQFCGSKPPPRPSPFSWLPRLLTPPLLGLGFRPAMVPNSVSR
jgi:hypothetical protein